MHEQAYKVLQIEMFVESVETRRHHLKQSLWLLWWRHSSERRETVTNQNPLVLCSTHRGPPKI